jgi:ferredoxin-NADP reductase/ferredoxin
MSLPDYDVVCVFEDNQTVKFKASPIETLYQAALRNGLKLETDCREGACGVCIAHCSSGTVDLGDFSDEALNEEDENAGYILPCQAKARSDLELHYNYPLSLLKETQSQVNAEVVAIEPWAENVVRLVVKPDSAVSFLPGQYANITVPGQNASRSFSFVNSADAPEQLEFCIRILAQGVMSDYLTQSAVVGDQLSLHAPFGQFFLRKPKFNHLLMIAGGTGIGPMLSMIEQLSTLDTPPQVALLYGANQRSELIPLAALEQRHDWLSIRTIAMDDEGVEQGFVTELIDAASLPLPKATQAYLCGPQPMIDAAGSVLLERDVAAAEIFSEKFIASS